MWRILLAIDLTLGIITFIIAGLGAVVDENDWTLGFAGWLLANVGLLGLGFVIWLMSVVWTWALK